MTASTPAPRQASETTTGTKATRPPQHKSAAATRRGHVLPPGCNLDIEGQTIGALVGHDDTFRFNGYNAVPPGDPVGDVLISWGDGTTGAGGAKTLARPFAAGCFETVFTGHHAYTRVTCKNGVCSTNYKVTVRYENERNHTRHTLTKLNVDILRPEKATPAAPSSG